MLIDRKAFFDALRKSLFTKGFKQSQVDGLQFILNVWEQHYQDRTGIIQLANALGQSYHETAFTMQPIHEYGDRAYFMKMYDKSGSRPNVAATLGNTEVGDGAKFPGMGLIQSTGRANARRNTRKLRALGIIGPDVDFETNPELMMKPEYAIHIMFLGMEEGWFTGRKLDDIVDEKIDGDEHADFIKARAIINGSDRAEKIADYSDAFLAALRVSLRFGPAPPVPLPAPAPERTIETKPVPPAAPSHIGPVTPAPTPAPAPASPVVAVVPDKPVVVPTAANPAPKGWFEHLLDVLRHDKGGKA